ncbi:MAG: 3-methyl-2-oxobutanoate hydroxymethyltransferase [Verrucomicrobia bacterium]|nr:3-methyl-2-oxobutanoate hydroxymethyltransferase [Verrucomicrobiota bacterium]
MRYGIALGSNLGDRLQNILAARAQLTAQGRILAAAPIYESAPVDCAQGDPPFYNTVLEYQTDLAPEELLTFTQSIEKNLGRRERHSHNAPREIDLDILYQVAGASGSHQLRHQSPNLQLPHPRLTQRRFVLHPLSQIRPDFSIDEKTVAQHLADLQSPEPPLAMVTASANPEKLDRLAAAKAAGRQIVAITAYDYPVARLMDEAGVDLILVGDSLGMVVLGHVDTTSVTLEMMVHHTLACRRGIQDAILVADLPIGTYNSPAEALSSARRLTEAGADAVKLEGALKQIEKIEAIIAAGIRVLGHIGMLPQRVREEGGYKKKGKTEADLEHIVSGARALESAGVDAIIMESTVPAAARRTTAAVDVPIIGIGAGKSCDGQIRVVHDVLGASPWFVPPFAKSHADLAGETTKAAKSYIDAVRAKEDS